MNYSWAISFFTLILGCAVGSNSPDITTRAIVSVKIATIGWSTSTLFAWAPALVLRPSVSTSVVITDIGFNDSLAERLKFLRPIPDQSSMDARVVAVITWKVGSQDTVAFGWPLVMTKNSEYYEFDLELLKLLTSRLPPEHQDELKLLIEVNELEK